MPRYSDSRSSLLDSDSDYYHRESRGRHRSRATSVLDRPPRDLRWDDHLQQTDRYGPPARIPSRHYDDDHLHHGGTLVRHERRRAESPSPRPRLLRRQSSLDTYDRLPSRKIDEYYTGYLPRGAPSPPPPRRGLRREELETLRISERDTRYREVQDSKPYPRKGKTRMPRKLVHVRAIREFGYPYEEEDDLVIIQLALSKEQIDDIIERSREIKRQAEAIPIRVSSPVRTTSRHRRVERVAMESYLPYPRASDTLLIEPSPERYLSPSPRDYDYSTRRTKRSVSRSRSISVKPRARRNSSPVRMYIERRDERSSNPGPLAMIIRPRDSDSDSDIDDYAVAQYRPPIDPTDLLYGDGEQEEVLEVKRERRGPSARRIRRMLATMT